LYFEQQHSDIDDSGDNDSYSKEDDCSNDAFMCRYNAELLLQINGTLLFSYK